MPFRSEKQRRYLYAHSDETREIAKRWTAKYGSQIQKRKAKPKPKPRPKPRPPRRPGY